LFKNIKKSAGAHIVASGVVFIWGITFISTIILLESFSPVEILIVRFAIGYLALLAFHPHFIKTGSFKRELLFIAAGLCGVTLYFLLENIALLYSTASNVGIIVPIAPLFTAVLAHFFLKGERLKLSFFAGFILAIAGIVLISLNGRFLLKLNPLGDILAALAAIVWAVYSVLMRKINQYDYNYIASTRRVFFYGIILMLPALIFMETSSDFSRFLDIQNIVNIAFLGLGASAACFAGWTWAVGVLGAVKTSLYIYAVPVVTIITAALVLKETITPFACVGAVLTLAGLYISERSSLKKTRPDDISRK
jgi:drug/metabolite transporter (DMT)-like permease